MQLYQRRQVWYFDFSLEGKRHRGSTGSSDAKEAREIAEEIRSRQRAINRDGPERVITFPECVRLYLDDGGSDRFLAPLIKKFRRTKIADIDGLSIRAAAKELHPDASPATWNRQVITPMRAVINRSAEAGRCKRIEVKRFPEIKKERPAGNKQWLEKFCKAALELGMPETAAIARFMFETGTRVSEAVRLEWKDIDIDEKRAFLERTKTVPRSVFFTEATVRLIAGLPRVGKVFGAANRSTVQKRFDRVIAKSKLERLTSHEIGRHGFYTEMIVRGGIDPKTAAEFGGSKSVRLVMETYVDADRDRAIIDRVFGKNGK